MSMLFATLREGPKTAVALMEEPRLSHRLVFRKNYLRSAKSVEMVEAAHPESPASKNRKCHLTVRE